MMMRQWRTITTRTRDGKLVARPCRDLHTLIFMMPAEPQDADAPASSPAQPSDVADAPWASLLAQMQPGDEIWAFCTDADSWRNLAGRAGYVLLRGNDEVARIVTLMN